MQVFAIDQAEATPDWEQHRHVEAAFVPIAEAGQRLRFEDYRWLLARVLRPPRTSPRCKTPGVGDLAPGLAQDRLPE